MTREDAYTELRFRFELDFRLHDYCIGEGRVRDLLKQFREGTPVQVSLTGEQIAAIVRAKGVDV